MTAVGYAVCWGGGGGWMWDLMEAQGRGTPSQPRVEGGRAGEGFP